MNIKPVSTPRPLPTRPTGATAPAAEPAPAKNPRPEIAEAEALIDRNFALGAALAMAKAGVDALVAKTAEVWPFGGGR